MIASRLVMAFLALASLLAYANVRNHWQNELDDYDTNGAPTTTTTTTISTLSTKKVIATAKSRRLPTLDELTSIPATGYECPEGTEVFENIVEPQRVTHPSDRKIPKIVHITAKTRCVTSGTKTHIRSWKFPDYSLYFHDDASVYKLLDYAVNDRHGNQLIRDFSRSLICLSNGAALSDVWRYLVLYYYGGIYTDLDNVPGPKFSTELIQPDTDSFFFVDGMGTMSQWHMASSRHHPLLLHFLGFVKRSLYKATDNVMVNNPITRTGPGAVQHGMASFRQAIDASYSYERQVPEGLYHGGVGTELELELPWYNNKRFEFDEDVDAGEGEGNNGHEYPTASELKNRTVTVFGDVTIAKSNIYIHQNGMIQKEEVWSKMNMTHYSNKGRGPKPKNKISCHQHAARMAELASTPTSFYYNKSGIAELSARYQYRADSDKHYFDPNTNETMIPWGKNMRI